MDFELQEILNEIPKRSDADAIYDNGVYIDTARNLFCVMPQGGGWIAIPLDILKEHALADLAPFSD